MADAGSPLGARLAHGDVAVLRQLLALLSEAVVVQDLDGRIIFANDAALAHVGLESWSDLQNQPTTTLMADYVVTDERGRVVVHDEMPAARLIRGEPAEPLLIRTIHRETGRVRWNQLKTTPLVDENGGLAGAVTVIEDVTEVKRSETRTHVLAESGRILASSLNFQQTLRNVTEIAVPSIADYCGVDIVDEAGRLARVAAVLNDPNAQDVAQALSELEPVLPDRSRRFAQVLLTGESFHLPEISNAELASVARNGEHLRLLQKLGIRSYMTVPLRVPSRTIGLMTLATTGSSGRSLDDSDLALAEQLGRRAAVAVENSRLHTKLATVAETLQRSLSPDPLPEIAHLDVAALYRPAETNLRIDVGGDFYEFFQHHGVWYLIFGDVAGKGVSAATITALLRHGARVASRAEPEPGTILARLNEALIQLPAGELATAMCACLHPDHIVISSAGHPQAMLVAPDGGIREVPTPGPLLGAFDGGDWPEQDVSLRPDELLVLYTDGVIEAPGRDERYGTERLRTFLRSNASLAPELIISRLERELDDFCVQPVNDDVAVLALRSRAEKRG